MTLSLSFTSIETTTNIARRNTLTSSLLSKCLVLCVVVSAIVDLWVTTLSFVVTPTMRILDIIVASNSVLLALNSTS